MLWDEECRAGTAFQLLSEGVLLLAPPVQTMGL